MEVVPLLSQEDLIKLGVSHVGERVMLVNLAKTRESRVKLINFMPNLLPTYRRRKDYFRSQGLVQWEAKYV